MKQFCFLVGIFLIHTYHSQNLIPNGDFEQYTNCITNESQLAYAFPWITPTTNNPGVSGTPDYFNACTVYPFISVPDNIFGYQPARSGSGYAGLFYISSINAGLREYLEIPLSTPLNPNTCYHFEMYANLGDQCKYTCSNLSAYFSDNIITGITNSSPLSFLTPQINNIAGNNLDTSNWTLISGDYYAHGGESHLILGNFLDDNNSDMNLYNSSGAWLSTYCFIDDVSLYQISSCTAGLGDYEFETNVSVYPVPAIDKLNVQTYNNEPTEIIIYDLTSRIYIKRKFTGFIVLDIEGLSKGVYFYELYSDARKYKTGKFIKS